jgi:hypothetical protein
VGDATVQHEQVRHTRNLGGIYTLEHISRESYWTVMETLCAFVRDRARWNWQDKPETPVGENERRKDDRAPANRHCGLR